MKCSISDTLYSNFVYEREGGKVLEVDHGFLIYKTINDECFICNMFVEKEFRQHGIGRSLINKLCNIADENGCSYITANIWMNDKNASKTLLSSLLVGFELMHTERNMITIIKRLVRD